MNPDIIGDILDKNEAFLISLNILIRVTEQ